MLITYGRKGGGLGNGDGPGALWLTPGRQYALQAIEVTADRGARFLIEDDSRSPSWWDAAHFEETQADISSDWVVSIGDTGSLFLGPAPWCQQGFWEQYWDGDPSAITVYQNFRGES